MRRAALKQSPKPRTDSESQGASWVSKKVRSIWYSILDLIQQPSYTIPLLINLSGSFIFFIIVGESGKWIRNLIENQVLTLESRT
jgi:hypothetical protein